MLPTLRRALRRLQTKILARNLFGPGERVVHGGPFKGLRYPPGISYGSEWLPKLVGSYELDIHDWLFDLCERPYRRVINIGCGEGYYAAGMARCMPDAEVFAFDISGTARTFCRRLVEENGVGERVEIQAECTIDVLESLISANTLIVCDCEGCEFDLLRPAAVKSLQRCDILIELHQRQTGVGATPESFLDRFTSTHNIRRRHFKPRRPEDFPLLEELPSLFRAFAVDENRSRGLDWALLEPKKATDQDRSTS